MNRKTFLATICALFSAPFIGKSKEKEPLTIDGIPVQDMDVQVYDFESDQYPGIRYEMNRKRRKNGKTGISLEEDLALLRQNTKDIL